jgi:hypothetical protein
VTGGTEADLTYQWYWRGEKLVGATNKTYAFPTLTIPSATTAEELKVEVAPRTQRSDIRTRAQAEAPTPVSATLALKSSIAWNAPLGQSNWYSMAKACASQSNDNKRPGTTAELKALVSALGNMKAYGVNTTNSYWTGTLGTGQGTHQQVSLLDGSEAFVGDTSTWERGLCVAGTAPAVPALGGKLANGHTFNENTFPTTGFVDAYFEFKDLKDSNANNWAYRSTDTSKAIVYNDGGWYAGVTLKAKGSVNIEVYNVAGGNPVIYPINPGKWFTNENYRNSLVQVKNKCTSVGGRVGERNEYSHNDNVRDIGSLYSEWGNVSAKFGTAYVWTNTAQSQNISNYTVNLGSGDYDRGDNTSDNNWTTCIK